MLGNKSSVMADGLVASCTACKGCHGMMLLVGKSHDWSLAPSCQSPAMVFLYQKHPSVTPFACGSAGNQTICHPTALAAKHFQWITPCPVSAVGIRCCDTTSSEISPPAFCRKSVTMWRSNHLYNPSVESSSIVQQMPPKKHAWTSVQEDSRVIASPGHFST